MSEQSYWEWVTENAQLNIATYFPWSSKKDGVDEGRYGEYARLLGEGQPSGREALLYVHIPYCLSICEYCHCDRMLVPKGRRLTELLDEYVALVLREARLYASTPYVRGLDIRHIHVGGGTPSLLSAEQINHLVRSLKAELHLGDGVALYFEGEVRTLRVREKLEALKALNCGRVSFGVQSFDPEVRRLSNLKPSLQDLVAMVEMLKGLSLEANVDLIYGLPAQSADSVRRDLDMIAQLGIASVDCYRNVVYPSLPVFQHRHRHPELLDERNKMHLYQLIFERLGEHGYRPVTDEVFNAAGARYSAIKQATTKSGEERVDIIGIGYGAISNLSGHCTRNAHGSEYARRIEEGTLPIVRMYVETEEERYTFMGVKGLGCGLRVRVGDRHYAGFRAAYSGVIDTLKRDGLAEEGPEYLALTKAGMLKHSAVQLAFLTDQQTRRMKQFTYDNVWKE